MKLQDNQTILEVMPEYYSHSQKWFNCIICKQNIVKFGDFFCVYKDTYVFRKNNLPFNMLLLNQYCEPIYKCPNCFSILDVTIDVDFVYFPIKSLNLKM